MSILSQVKSRICKVEWGVAIRERMSSSLFFDKNNTPPIFTPIQNSFRYWAADPFIIDFNNKVYLFVELYDRIKRKGLLGYMDITVGVKNKFKIVFETNCHLSYPLCFVSEGDLYAIPESNNIKKLLLLKWDDTKEIFYEIETFMEGYCLADSTFIMKNKEIYMLATEVTKQDNVSTLSIFKHVGKEFMASSSNPIVTDKTTARNGGNIIHKDGILYRVSQDCSRGYGSAINLMRIENLSLENYKETLVKKILPSHIKVKGLNCIDGIHTYNSNARWEVIDYKISHKFSLAELIGYVLCKFKVFTKIEK